MLFKKYRFVLLTGLLLALFLISIGLYLWFLPHRNVQAARVDERLTVEQLVSEFANNPEKANNKYLASDGNSQILIVTGRVDQILKNSKGELVVILKDPTSPVGVSATFVKEAIGEAGAIAVNDTIQVKGVITAGNRYDTLLELYEHAVLIQCDLVR